MPRTETVSTEVFKFEELSDAAKEKARQWWRDADDGDNFWSESVIEDAATIADLMGIDLRTRAVKLMGGGTRYEPEIYWSGFWSQGDGACFVGSYAYKAGSVKAVRQHAPKDSELHRIARGLAAAQRPNFYRIEATLKKSDHHYSHENTVSIDVFYSEAGEYGSEPKNAADFRELLRDFMRWIYKQLEAEYNYHNSDEQVDESIKANEYDFTEDGSHY